MQYYDIGILMALYINFDRSIKECVLWIDPQCYLKNNSNILSRLISEDL